MGRETQVAGIVLCGGSGRRFQGADKPLLPLHGRPMLAHVLERLTPQVASIVISANRNADEYAAFGHPVIPDLKPDQGPLAGLVATLPCTDCGLLFLCPGDAPLLSADLVGRLREQLTAGVDAAIPLDGERAQHLFMLLRRQAAETAADYLARGGRSVAGFVETLNLAVVPVGNRGSFTNVNTQADLEAVEQGWRSDPV